MFAAFALVPTLVEESLCFWGEGREWGLFGMLVTPRKSVHVWEVDLQSCMRLLMTDCL